MTKVESFSIDEIIGGKNKDEIWVNEFTESSAQRFRESVLYAAKQNSQKPIIIYIDSYGGNADSLATMIATMDDVDNPIITVCMGKAMSCGAILLSHGDLRFCDQHARVMIHEVSSGTYGDVHDIAADAAEIKRLNEHFMTLLAKNCGLKNGYSDLRKMIKEQDGRDKYLSAQEAKEFGIVDMVGLPKISVSTVYELSVTPPKEKSVRKTGVQLKTKNDKEKTKTKSKKGKS